MGLLSDDVKKKLSEEPDWQVQFGAPPGMVHHEVVIHDVGWHIVHPKSCKAHPGKGREQLTIATQSYRATGERKVEPCRFDEVAKGWTKKVADNGIYQWKKANGPLELKVR